MAEDVEQALEEHGADDQVGRSLEVDDAHSTHVALALQEAAHRTGEELAAERGAVDLDEEPLEECRIADEVREHREEGDLDRVGTTDDGPQAVDDVCDTWLDCIGVVRGGDPIESPYERGQEELVLVGEVVVEDAVGEPGRARDVAARDGDGPSLGEEGLCRVEQASADLVGRGSGPLGP
jgi:hypothetical protein